MQATRRLLQQRQPMIKFVGSRHQAPQKLDHTPHPHPAAPTSSLPKSFAQYREEATQHGPLKGSRQTQNTSTAPSGGNPGTAGGGGGTQPQSPLNPYGSIGGRSARELGPIRAGKGEVLDRNDLPGRFWRVPWSQSEIEAVESGGASLVV